MTPSERALMAALLAVSGYAAAVLSLFAGQFLLVGLLLVVGLAVTPKLFRWLTGRFRDSRARSAEANPRE